MSEVTQVQHRITEVPSSIGIRTAPFALEVSGISKSYAHRRRETKVLSDVSLQVEPQEFVSIVGPSGCGKSTLFHIIGGLEQPDSGTVSMNGNVVTGQRGMISYMPQQPALFPWRTIEENVLLATEIAGQVRDTAREEARHWLAKVGLAGFERAYPHMLSGGMQQRAAFLRALLAPQELMLLDEPFSALDAGLRVATRRAVGKVLHDAGVTTISQETGRDVAPADLVSRIIEELRNNEEALVATHEGALL